MIVILIVLAVVGTGVLLLLIAQLRTEFEASRGEVHQRWDDNRQRENEPPVSSEETDSRLSQQPDPAPDPQEGVTASPTNAAGRSHCPACAASITAKDERCPSCDICFVADGSQTWSLGAVGPADGIWLPPNEVSEKPSSD